MVLILTKVLDAMMIAIPVILAIIILWCLLSMRGSLKLKDGLKKVLLFLPVIIAVVFFAGVISIVGGKIKSTKTASISLGYNYPGAADGLAPNNTKLDYEEIISDSVLEKVLQNYNFGDLTVDELKPTLSVRNAKPITGLSYKNAFISTQFYVDYTASKATSGCSGSALLTAIADTYRQMFEERYSKKFNILQFDLKEAEELDYLDICAYLRRRFTAISDYMSECKNENATFTSDSTGQTFASIGAKAIDFRDTNIEKLEAYILKYGLSKDKGRYVSRLNYDNKILNVEYMKNLQAYAVRIAAIDKYERDITKAVLVPTRDQTGEFYQSRTKIGTDFYAEDANRLINNAANNVLTMDTNNYTIQQLLAAKGGNKEIEEAERLISELEDEAVKLARNGITTVTEYEQKYSKNYMNISHVTVSNMSILKSGIIYMAFIGLLSCLAAFLVSGMKKER